MKIKVCGMKYQENMTAVADLQPDYMGFIFYQNSPRNFEGTIAKLPEQIKKTGVFVDASIPFIIEKVTQYNFRAIQLHGQESPEFCSALKKELLMITTNSKSDQTNPESVAIEIWKVFSIKDTFDFNTLIPYEGIVDYFLFDTKGKEKGGNGYTFDWRVLEHYPSTTPFVLSGGIGLDEIEKIKNILKTDLPIHALDINSKFESEPGIKQIDTLEVFIKNIKNHLREG